MELLVKQVDAEDIFNDMVRVHTSHRPGIPAGTICKINANGIAILAVARNTRSNERDIIAIDDALRTRLGVKEGKSYDFKIAEAGFLDQFAWGCLASNPVNRIASRLAALSIILTEIGLLLALWSVYLSLK